MTTFIEIRLEIRKLEAKNTLTENHKTRFDAKLVFKEIPLLMLTIQNKVLFIILPIRIKYCASK